jgi:glutamate-1-semialdehyde 2,1-aminomutase
VLYGGTYNGQQGAVAAATVCLEKLKDGQIQKRLQDMTQTLSDAFKQRTEARDIPARLDHCGGQFQVFFTDHDIIDYRTVYSVDRESYQTFYETAFGNGIWLNGYYLFHHGVTFAHSDEDISAILSAFEKGLDAVKKREK